jgi:coatomer subunit delta
VAFSKTSPFVEVDVSSVSLLDMDESVGFSKDVKSAAEGYSIE